MTTEEGEALLTEALTADTADPDCRPALLGAAWYAEDRGDAVRAVSLLRRARVEPGDSQLDRLAAWAAPAPAGNVGRNDPCPCGSGRKYKVCCQRRRGQPLAARAGWLLDKAGTYAHRSLHRPQLLPLVEARAGDPEDHHRLLEAMRDPLVQDLTLFEEGEQTVFCEAVYEVADAPAAARALDGRYERQGANRWAERVDTDTGTWTRGTLHPEGERLVVHTTAVPRLERFKHVLGELVPDATLADEERRTLDDVRRSGAPVRRCPSRPRRPRRPRRAKPASLTPPSTR